MDPQIIMRVTGIAINDAIVGIQQAVSNLLDEDLKSFEQYLEQQDALTPS